MSTVYVWDFNGRSLMEPQLINCLFFFCTQSWSVFQVKYLEKYLYLIINLTQRLRFLIYIYIETANWFSMYLISIKYYWKNITPAWEVYINNMVSQKRKIRKKMYRLGDVILMFFRLGDLRSYELISSNHEAQENGLQYFDE